MPQTTYPWLAPLDAASALASEPQLVLLYSGQNEHHSGRFSFLAWGCAETLCSSHWADIADKLSSQEPWYDNAWFGWLGYGLRCDSEQLARGTPSPIDLPDSQLMRFRHLLRFDHHERQITYAATEAPDLRWQHPQTCASSPVKVDGLTSPITKAQYLDSIRRTKERIEAGDFYQANITRKFTGRLLNKPDSFYLFQPLCSISQSSYSAYIRSGETAIISSSPECFLTIDPQGKMISRPIKGSAARGASPAEDEHIKARLRESTKDRAENRMIVDLVRNDLSRSAYAGTIEVTSDAELVSYSTVHHLVSTIRGRKRDDTPTIEAVRHCFPPGSMTGAPKIAAMQWCNTMERLERGIYSGAIGWFGGDGSCDLSVVIRTLILQGERFEFQVGGGIVADSDPEQEWMETLIKARGIARLLGIEESALAAL